MRARISDPDTGSLKISTTSRQRAGWRGAPDCALLAVDGREAIQTEAALVPAEADRRPPGAVVHPAAAPRRRLARPLADRPGRAAGRPGGAGVDPLHPLRGGPRLGLRG